jgi:hypothetical protein
VQLVPAVAPIVITPVLSFPVIVAAVVPQLLEVVFDTAGAVPPVTNGLANVMPCEVSIVIAVVLFVPNLSVFDPNVPTSRPPRIARISAVPPIAPPQRVVVLAVPLAIASIATVSEIAV